jgi:hypothetical protein
MHGQVPVQTEQELVELMQQGIANRTVASTGMNVASSRSHCLINLMVEKHFPDGSFSYGKLCLVDLAGAQSQPLMQSCTSITERKHAPCHAWHDRLCKYEESP